MNRNKMGKSMSGITLIALVITIIVLLILAAVSIATLTGENGILTEAAKANEETEKASEKEQRKLAMLEAMTNLENTKYIDKSGNIVIIPAGFAPTRIEGENTVNEGLVIIDSKGNEFVWIPVELEDDETFESKYTRTEFSDNHPSTTLTDNTSWIEPYINGYEEEIEEYNNMVDSVTKNGGFYVGRYEAGCEKQRTNSNAVNTQTVLVQKGKYIYNLVPWGNSISSMEMNAQGIEGAANLSRNFANEHGYTTVTSTLIYGIQWDMIMRFIADDSHNVNNSSNWGNYNDSIGDASTNSGAYVMNYTAGRNEAWKAKNIYDMAGSVWEWTMEVFSGSYRVCRGGSIYNGSKYSAASRYIMGTPDYINPCIGFRVTLYL